MLGTVESGLPALSPQELDDAVCAMNDDERALRAVEAFCAREDAWTLSETILMSDCHSSTKFMAMRLLRNRIDTHWNAFDVGGKLRVLELVQSVISNFLAEGADCSAISMANMALVAILKYEWPQSLPNFIVEMISASTNSPRVRANNLKILSFLADDIKIFREGALTFDRYSVMVAAFLKDFPVIAEIMNSVFTAEASTEEINNVLDAFWHFVPLFQEKEKFEGVLLETFWQFMSNPECSLRVFAIYGRLYAEDCLTENMVQMVPRIFKHAVQCLRVLLGDDVSGMPDEKASLLVSSFTPFLADYLNQTSQSITAEELSVVTGWIAQITQTADSEDLFTACVGFWQRFSRTVMVDIRRGNRGAGQLEPAGRLLPVFVLHMPKFYEIYTDADDAGSRISEVRVHVESWALPTMMQDLLVYLTHLLPDGFVYRTIVELTQQMSDSQTVDSVCGLLGAVSRVLPVERVTELFVSVTQAVLELHAMAGSDGVFDPDSYIYMCSRQRHIFDMKNDLVDSLVPILFHWMKTGKRETRTVACYTFKTLAQSCRGAFIRPVGEGACVIDKLLSDFDGMCQGLENQDIIRVIGAMCSIIKKMSAERQDECFGFMYQRLRMAWQQQELNPLDSNSVHSTIFLVKCYQQIASGMKMASGHVLKELMTSDRGFIPVYRVYAEAAIANSGEPSEVLRCQKQVKSSIISMLTSFLARLITPTSTAFDLDELTPILIDYEVAPPLARVENVLDLYAVIISQMGKAIVGRLPQIWRALFDTTITMVCVDYDSFIEFKLPLMRLMRGVLLGRACSLIVSEPAIFATFCQSIDWFASHPHQNVCLMALDLYTILVIKVVMKQKYDSLCGLIAAKLIPEAFGLLMDDIHKYAFDQLVRLIRNLMKIDAVKQNTGMLATLLSPLAPGVDFAFLLNFMTQDGDYMQSREIMRDFLVQTRQYRPDDPNLTKAESALTLEQERSLRAEVPGLQNDPTDSERVDEEVTTLTSDLAALMNL